MVNCSYCGKQLDRKVFCSNSHKVMYHTAPGEVAETPEDIDVTYEAPAPEVQIRGSFTDLNPAPKPKKK